MSALTTLITVTATLTVPIRMVPSLVLVKQVGVEMESRVQVRSNPCSSLLISNAQSEYFMEAVNIIHTPYCSLKNIQMKFPYHLVRIGETKRTDGGDH